MAQINPIDHKETTTMCWFCERNPADPDAGVSVTLKRDISTKSTMHWEVTKANMYGIYIPRCKQCKEFRDYSQKLGKFVSWMIIIMIILVAAGFGINSILPEEVPGFVAPVVGGLLIIPVILISAKKIRKPENYAKKYDIMDYPELEAMINDGWEVSSVHY